MKGKLLAKGKDGRKRKELIETANAWKGIGVDVEAEEFPDEGNPSLYLFYKLLMVNYHFHHYTR